MRIRALMFVSLAAMAVLGIGVSSASAATLFTTTAHTARVSVGATAVATGTDINLLSGTAVINTCAHSALNLTLTQNNDTAVIAEVTGGSFNGCNSPVTPTFPWTLTVSGNGTVVAPNTCWNATVDNVHFHLFGGTYHGTLNTGVTACQPTSGTSPLTLTLNNAGTITGPLTGAGKITGKYAFTGAAAAYSLTN